MLELINEVSEAVERDENNIPNNNQFRSFQELIRRRLINRRGCNSNYLGSPDAELFAECKAHMDKHNRPIVQPHLAILVHPFYLTLSHQPYLTEGSRPSYEEYLRHLGKLLKSRNKSNLGILFFETLHHYASLTSSLLESGVIDQVQFTEFDYGTPLDKNKLTELNVKDIYMGGGYQGKCLSKSYGDISELFSNTPIFMISTLILYSPQDWSDSLRPDNHFLHNPITLTQLLEKTS